MTDNPFAPPQESKPSDGAKTRESNGTPIALAMILGGVIVGFIMGAIESDSTSSFGFNLVLFSSLGLFVGIGYLVFRWSYLWIAERLDEL